MFERFRKQTVLIWPLLLFLFFSSNAFTYAVVSPKDTAKSVSPLYEEMLANQIYSLRRELLDQKTITEEDPFYLFSDEEGQVLIADIGKILKKNHPAISWSMNAGEKGMVGVQLIHDVEKWLTSKFKNPISYVLVLTDEPPDDKLLAKLSAKGLLVHSELSLFELEFVKNEQGRQIVNLDDPSVQNRVFQRLVREGMNPVFAHSATDEGIKNFRKLKKPKLLIFDRILT